MSARQCPSCGAAVDLPPGVLAKTCAFCDSPLVDAAGEGEPVDLVVPFLLDRRQATTRLVAHLKESVWAPEEVRRLSRAEELDGVLVPFWVFDARTDTHYSAQLGIEWYRTETYTVTVKGKAQVRTRRVREVEWFPVSGRHGKRYTQHLVSGSKGLAEAEANQLEPFDLGRALPWSPEAVAGNLAERPTVDHASAAATAAAELRGAEQEAVLRFLVGDEERGLQTQTTVEVGKVQLALLPVWIASYRHQGKVIRLLVNGQTGEVVGEVPRSWTKIIVAVVVAVLLLALLCGAGALFVSIMEGRG
jgi:hypothetical protein